MNLHIKYFLTIIILIFSTEIYGQKILWWFDTKDASFGQTAAGDIDNDGKLELVFGCYRNDSCVYALNSEDGSLLWKYNTSSTLAEGCNDVASLIYDIDGDLLKDVIVPSSCNPKTYCFNGLDGSIKWEAVTRGSDSPPTLGDIDGDGKLEILHGEFSGYVICLDAKTGNRKWEFLVQKNTWIQTAPTLVDLDGDGLLDFVVSTWCLFKEDTNRIYAFRGYDRKLLWSMNLAGTVYHGTAIADLDEDNKPELVFGDYSGVLYCLNGEDGSKYWDYTDNMVIYIGSPVTIGDLNGNGQLEIVFTSAYFTTVLSFDGKLLWKYKNPSNSYVFRGAALADIDDDGLPDVIYGTSSGHIIGLKGTNGNELIKVDLASHIGETFSIDHCPVISDFNGDDTLDLFIVGGFTEYPDFSKNYGRAYALSLGKGKGPDWLMFQNNIRRTGMLDRLTSQIQENISNSSDFEFRYIIEEESIEISFKQNKPINSGSYVFIYSYIGEIVKTIKTNGEQSIIVNLNNLPKGLYFVRLNQEIVKFIYY